MTGRLRFAFERAESALMFNFPVEPGPYSKTFGFLSSFETNPYGTMAATVPCTVRVDKMRRPPACPKAGREGVAPFPLVLPPPCRRSALRCSTVQHPSLDASSSLIRCVVLSGLDTSKDCIRTSFRTAFAVDSTSTPPRIATLAQQLYQQFSRFKRLAVCRIRC